MAMSWMRFPSVCLNCCILSSPFPSDRKRYFFTQAKQRRGNKRTDLTLKWAFSIYLWQDLICHMCHTATPEKHTPIILYDDLQLTNRMSYNCHDAFNGSNNLDDKIIIIKIVFVMSLCLTVTPSCTSLWTKKKKKAAITPLHFLTLLYHQPVRLHCCYSVQHPDNNSITKVERGHSLNPEKCWWADEIHYSCCSSTFLSEPS